MRIFICFLFLVSFVAFAQEDIPVQTIKVNTVTVKTAEIPVIQSVPITVEGVKVVQQQVTVQRVQSFQVPQTVVALIQALPLNVITNQVAPFEVIISQVTIPSIIAKTVQLITIVQASARLPQLQKILSMTKTFLDQRNLRNDPDFGLDSVAWKKWLSIYQKNQPYTLVYKPLPQDLKIIAQVKCAQGEQQRATLQRNLQFYKSEGYNAVLLTFDTTEDITQLQATITKVKACGFKIVCAYTGPQKLKWSIYKDPDVLQQYIGTVCSRSDAFLLGWRRTSAHLLIMDPPYRNHLLKTARKFNPQIPVIGQAYYGEIQKGRRVVYNVPSNASAVLLIGIGYSGISIQKACKNVFDKIKNMPKLGLVIGERPYYDSLGLTKKTLEQNLKIKKRIQNRFRLGGCIGTLTMRGDGSDGLYDSRYTQNLSLDYK